MPCKSVFIWSKSVQGFRSKSLGSKWEQLNAVVAPTVSVLYGPMLKYSVLVVIIVCCSYVVMNTPTDLLFGLLLECF